MPLDPLISIVIPTFNRADLIGYTLDSILKQTYRHWECIVVDDGSTDGTAGIMADRITQDARFQYCQRPENLPKGGNSCRNYGFAISSGAFVNWFDSDDIMYPDFLQHKITPLLQDQTLDFCACLQETFQDSDPTIRKPMVPAKLTADHFESDFLLNGLSFYTPSPLWRRTFLEGKSLFDPTFARAQETDFHLRMLSHHPRFIYIPDILYGIRVGNSGISSQSQLSLAAQQSIFRYFHNAFQLVVKNQPPEKIKLLCYLFYRLCINYYSQNGIGNRNSLYRQYAPILRQCARIAQIPIGTRMRLEIGFFLLRGFGKGYALFYFPQYDARKSKADKM